MSGFKRAVTWLCITALAAFVAHANADAVLCVSVDHTAVEAAHDDGACVETAARAAESLGTPAAPCSDTPLAVSAAAAESQVAAPYSVSAVSLRVPEPVRAVLARRPDAAASPPAIARAIASTVLLL